ncbi:MAG TPA: AI-2E family transporter, partial [Flavisolibacter sp.]|nr:AI-2E family transporter [Flavisolibacter sp.]
MGICRDPSTSTVFAKLVNPLICVVIIFAILYVGRDILIPFSFSCLLALLLISPCHFFERQGCPRGIAALISLFLALMSFLVVFYFISNSLFSFKKDLPLMIDNLNQSLNQLENSIQKQFHVSTSKMQEFVNSSTKNVLPSTSSLINSTVTTVTNAFFVSIVIFITTFLLLLYRGLIVLFVTSLFAAEHTERILEIFLKTRFVIRSYIVGLFIEMLIVAIAYSSALFIIGVKYALLLGVIGAILNLIPYIGIFMACILSSLITLTTSSPGKIVWLVACLLIIHITDSNILMPKVVGAKVKLNALVTIMGVIIGSALWGIAGMFMAVPIMAIL